MNLPPDLTEFSVGVTTSGTVNTQTTGTLVAAPGAGLRFRLWAFAAAPNLTAQAVVNWRADCANGVGGNSILSVTSANFLNPGLLVIPGGRPLSANTAIGYLIAAALASMGLGLYVFYTTETV